MQTARIEIDNLRDNLVRLCAERGEVQRIAGVAKITRVYLSRIIHGHAEPSYVVALKLADAVGMTLAELSTKPQKKVRKTA